MRDAVRTVAVTLLVLILPGLWLALSPDPSATQMRGLVGLGPQEDDRSFTFLQRQSGSGRPIGWDPCEPIRYVVDPTDAPDDWAEELERATTELTDASGIAFTFDGTVSDRDFEPQPAMFGDHPPVLVAWSDADEHPRLAGDVAGLGGATAFGTPGRQRYVTGAVVLDTEDADGRSLAERDVVFAGDTEALLVHELAHVMGLGHTEDPTQLMYAEQTGVMELAAGDRAGLRRLGDLPCG